jgi:hypothetical protein
MFASTLSGRSIDDVQFPKSYALGIATAVAMLALSLLVAVYFYMQASLRD